MSALSTMQGGQQFWNQNSTRSLWLWNFLRDTLTI
jgi:hypothetical protein